MFGIEKSKWEELGGLKTATEIRQQPELWEEVLEIIENQKDEIDSYLKKFYKDKKDLRIIFTGAGTSAYVGRIVVPHLNSNDDNYRFEAIATTDLVDNPEIYFKKDIPTMLVSFARSGNSPESVAAYNLANQIVDDISHIFITCNEEGELAKISEENPENTLLILMPARSNDQGFAMTGSFSCMTLASNLIFEENYDEVVKQSKRAIEIGNNILEEDYKQIDKLMEKEFDRVVYLGSGSYYGLAKESSLKLLELTRGRITSLSETPLGFRHGPKSILNDNTLVFIYISEDEYRRKYDMDLLNEVYNNIGEHTVISVTENKDDSVINISDMNLSLTEDEIIGNTVISSLLYALYAQVVSLKASLKSNIEPDNPNPSGLVNRVVEGVTIHPFE